ncbi:hypothetical protein A3Q56_02180, partial [Intoshia linei]
MSIFSTISLSRQAVVTSLTFTIIMTAYVHNLMDYQSRQEKLSLHRKIRKKDMKIPGLGFN